MYVDSVYSLVALGLTMVFGLIGAVQLIGPRFVREAYKRWDYGPSVRIVTGVLDAIAAIMLAVPLLRGWGIGLAAILTFGSVVVFLSHRQYRYALPAIGLMIALVPATIAVPRPAQIHSSPRRPSRPTDRRGSWHRTTAQFQRSPSNWANDARSDQAVAVSLASRSPCLRDPYRGRYIAIAKSCADVDKPIDPLIFVPGSLPPDDLTPCHSDLQDVLSGTKLGLRANRLHQIGTGHHTAPKAAGPAYK